MDYKALPFGGLFRTDTRHAARTFRAGFQWDWFEADLNDAARALFRRLDDVFHILKTDGFVFLSTIELDAEAGRFPDVLAQYFRDEAWSDEQAYFVAPIMNIPGRAYATGRLTFRAEPGQTVRALAQGDGFRWGSALLVWGLQVSEADVAETIAMSPGEESDLGRIERMARAAWLADIDLNSLALWLSPGVDGESRLKLLALQSA